MPQKRISTNDATRVEFTCECNNGVFRLVRSDPALSEKIYQWEHQCTACATTAYFTIPYPFYEIVSNNVVRQFMLKEAMPQLE